MQTPQMATHPRALHIERARTHALVVPEKTSSLLIQASRNPDVRAHSSNPRALTEICTHVHACTRTPNSDPSISPPLNASHHTHPEKPPLGRRGTPFSERRFQFPKRWQRPWQEVYTAQRKHVLGDSLIIITANSACAGGVGLMPQWARPAAAGPLTLRRARPGSGKQTACGRRARPRAARRAWLPARGARTQLRSVRLAAPPCKSGQCWREKALRSAGHAGAPRLAQNQVSAVVLQTAGRPSASLSARVPDPKQAPGVRS